MNNQDEADLLFMLSALPEPSCDDRSRAPWVEDFTLKLAVKLICCFENV